jgi:hypothetical protein
MELSGWCGKCSKSGTALLPPLSRLALNQYLMQRGVRTTPAMGKLPPRSLLICGTATEKLRQASSHRMRYTNPLDVQPFTRGEVPHHQSEFI